MSSVGVIIQARINSSRLPGKVMKTIAAKPMLYHVLNQVNNSKNADIVILATSDQSDDDIIEEFCKKQNQTFFRGSKNDLLDRYYKCAKQFNLDIIVRITSDCPLIDPELIDKMISHFMKNDNDYYSNNFEKINGDWKNSKCNFPQGMTVEICTFSTLERAWKSASSLSEREHVFPYVQFHPELFNLENKIFHHDLSYIRCTVDHPEDLEFICKIYELMPKNLDYITISEIETIVKQHPEIVKINNFFDFEEGYKISLDKERNLKK